MSIIWETNAPQSATVKPQTKSVKSVKSVKSAKPQAALLRPRFQVFVGAYVVLAVFVSFCVVAWLIGCANPSPEAGKGGQHGSTTL